MSYSPNYYASPYPPSSAGSYASQYQPPQVKGSPHAPSIPTSFASWGTVQTPHSGYSYSSAQPAPHGYNHHSAAASAAPSAHSPYSSSFSPSQTSSSSLSSPVSSLYRASPGSSFKGHYVSSSSASPNAQVSSEVCEYLRPDRAFTLGWDVAHLGPPAFFARGGVNPDAPAFSPSTREVTLEFQGLAHPAWRARIVTGSHSSSSSYSSSSASISGFSSSSSSHSSSAQSYTMTITSPGPYITISTLLQTISAYCHSTVHRDQQSQMPASVWQAAKASYMVRMQRGASGGHQAMTMLDVLGARTAFMGVMRKEMSGGGDEVWVVCLANVGGGACAVN